MQLIMAPLHGITTAPLRNAFFCWFEGFDRAVAPFITTVRAETVALSHLRDILPENNAGHELIPQVIGNSPGPILQLAQAFADLGYREVNWNLGCPFPKVTAKQRGCGLLPHPERIVDILDHVVPRLDCTFSLKLRLGLNHAGEILELLPRLEGFPLGPLTIHARTGSQMYSGAVDLEGFEACLDQTNHQVIYNGDIDSVEGFHELHNRLGDRVSGWMIGRGALRDPFLPARITGASLPAPGECLRRLRGFHDQVYRNYGELLQGSAHILGKMKELWRFMGASFHDGRRQVGRLCRATSRKRYEEVVDRVFERSRARASDSC
jgi:tRNA-dihydrouridine synthase